jgi:hypothetical protein
MERSDTITLGILAHFRHFRHFFILIFLRQLLGFAGTPQQLNPILDPVFDILFDRCIDLARIVFFPVI